MPLSHFKVWSVIKVILGMHIIKATAKVSRNDILLEGLKRGANENYACM